MDTMRKQIKSARSWSDHDQGENDMIMMMMTMMTMMMMMLMMMMMIIIVVIIIIIIIITMFYCYYHHYYDYYYYQNYYYYYYHHYDDYIIIIIMMITNIATQQGRRQMWEWSSGSFETKSAVPKFLEFEGRNISKAKCYPKLGSPIPLNMVSLDQFLGFAATFQ